LLPDPYVYPGTSCLRNLAGIRDPAELGQFEAEQTSIILAQIQREPVPGRYDLGHLRAFHRRIFGDIYEWAGESRTVTIGKDQSLFALPEHIEGYLTKVLTQLVEEKLLHALEREVFVDRLTHYYYVELNAAHPFREGNGRTQRAFLGQLAHEAGYHISWERLDGERNIRLAGEPRRGQRATARAARRAGRARAGDSLTSPPLAPRID
jgi:cell filamentation protein